MSERECCAYCGARALRDESGVIVAWAAAIGLNGAGEHDHETIEGERD